MFLTTQYQVAWLERDGVLAAGAGNPLLDKGIRAVCEDWSRGSGDTIARAFRWTPAAFAAYPPSCMTPPTWLPCIALTDPYLIPYGRDRKSVV